VVCASALALGSSLIRGIAGALQIGACCDPLLAVCTGILVRATAISPS